MRLEAGVDRSIAAVMRYLVRTMNSPGGSAAANNISLAQLPFDMAVAVPLAALTQVGWAIAIGNFRYGFRSRKVQLVMP